MDELDRSRVRETPSGVTLEVVVVTRAKRTRFVGFHGGRPKFALAAIPESGQANDELRRVVALLFGIPSQSIEVLRGHTSRLKTLLLRGLNPANVAQLLESATPS